MGRVGIDWNKEYYAEAIMSGQRKKGLKNKAYVSASMENDGKKIQVMPYA